MKATSQPSAIFFLLKSLRYHLLVTKKQSKFCSLPTVATTYSRHVKPHNSLNLLCFFPPCALIMPGLISKSLPPGSLFQLPQGKSSSSPVSVWYSCHLVLGPQVLPGSSVTSTSTTVQSTEQCSPLPFPQGSCRARPGASNTGEMVPNEWKAGYEGHSQKLQTGLYTCLL